ncbi:precorrin-3B C(17)-methyltransferase [Chloroflexus sp.]|uniref:precorrin-3B C(17)-methyltransferase n=1 Tax=Chloroflexus sp. TaxID=1904827 RepID=UPI00298EEF89|nr:precorrin-3B C(17)-methyltransferase [Chloroflexus sp.]MDW8405378.1 precorrin-3B C(17)-methyltransferase [Chloroflexus sp.]
MTNIAIIAVTRAGVALAERLAAALPATVWAPARFAPEVPSARAYATVAEAMQAAWATAQAIVFIGAAGIAVRAIAPLLRAKTVDPAVVCLDEHGQFAVPLVGGHRAGANDLARRLAAITGGSAVLTTASDTQGLPALDLIGRDHGWRLAVDSATTHVMACLVNGDPIGVWVDPALPAARDRLESELAAAPTIEWVDDPAYLAAERFAAAIIVSHRRLAGLWAELRNKSLRYLLPVLTVGIGCRRETPVDELAAALATTLAEADLLSECVATIATAELKASEPGISALAAQLGVPLTIIATEQLRALEPETFSPSAAIRFDLPGVAEPCAVLAAKGPLLVPKRSFARCTIAVALRVTATHSRDSTTTAGQLVLVSIGPGDLAHLTAAARQALAQAEVITGYGRYIDLIRPLLRPDQEVLATPAMGDEMGRARAAIELARAGRRVALISSGDIGIYAMAAPVFETLQAEGWTGREPMVEVIPGVSAFQALAARLGAPVNHDLCLISLSDLLTPWPLIERRLRAAAQADFVIALYNPRSQGRNWQLAAALAIVREHRSPHTPVAFGRQVTRADEQIVLTTLAEADPAQADMLTVVLIGNRQSFALAGHMVTPRGYTARAATPEPAMPAVPVRDYPIVLTKPAHLPAVVIGGGPVGERKVRGLLAAGFPVRLISPTATAQLAAWAAEGRLIWEQRAYQAGDLAGARLVFAATNDRAVNARIAAAASAAGALCNVADAPDEGDFHVPAVHRSGELTIAVSSHGTAPARAAAVRDAIADWLAEGVPSA